MIGPGEETAGSHSYDNCLCMLKKNLVVLRRQKNSVALPLTTCRSSWSLQQRNSYLLPRNSDSASYISTCIIIPQTNNFLVILKVLTSFFSPYPNPRKETAGRERCDDRKQKHSLLCPVTQFDTIHLLCSDQTIGQKHFR